VTVAATDILLHSIPTPLGFPSQYLGHLLMFELVHGQIFWATLYRVIAADEQAARNLQIGWCTNGVVIFVYLASISGGTSIRPICSAGAIPRPTVCGSLSLGEIWV